MLARQVARTAGRTFVQARFNTQKVEKNAAGEVVFPHEFRNYDVEEPHKNQKDVAGFPMTGLILLAIQFNFLLVFGEGEPEFPIVGQYLSVFA